MPDPASPEFVAAFEAAKSASSAQLLMRCGRLINERGIARVRARFGLPLRAAHTNLFPHIDLEGTRPSELARRLGVSKQAVHPLVEELVSFGVLERVPDPSDGRALLVRFSSSGTNWLMDGMAVLGEVDAELSIALGARRARELHRALKALEAWLSEEADGGVAE